MTSKVLFSVLLIVGVLIILASVFAHSLGLGHVGFGTKKLIGIAVGAIVAIVGIWGIVRQP